MSLARHDSRDRFVSGQKPDWAPRALQIKRVIESEKRLADALAVIRRLRKDREKLKARWFGVGALSVIAVMGIGYFAVTTIGARL